jgi:hypothetical protein
MFFEDGGAERRRTGEPPVPLDPTGRRKRAISIRNGYYFNNLLTGGFPCNCQCFSFIPILVSSKSGTVII